MLGPRDARGLQAVLLCVGLLSFVVGALAGLPLMRWVSRVQPSDGFPTLALIALAIPSASIGLGAWAWRRNKVRKLASGYAIATGVGGLGIIAIEVFFGLVLLMLSRGS